MQTSAAISAHVIAHTCAHSRPESLKSIVFLDICASKCDCTRVRTPLPGTYACAKEAGGNTGAIYAHVIAHTCAHSGSESLKSIVFSTFVQTSALRYLCLHT